MPSSAAAHRPRARRFEAAMREARSRSSAPLSPNGIVRDPVVSAAHAALKTPAARAALMAWPERALSGDLFVDIGRISLVNETQLKPQPDDEHDGYGKKPLRDPCDDIDFVHDVLRSVGLVPTKNTVLHAPISNKRNV
jgi:hypothetical protein